MMKLNQRMKNYYESSDSYLSHLHDEDDNKRKSYVRYMIRYVENSNKVLELGGGIGKAAEQLALTKNAKVTVTDLSSKFIKEARKQVKLKNMSFDVQNALNLTYNRDSFDVVTSMGLLEHLPDPKKGIDEMLRVTKPGGKIIVVFPNWYSPFRVLKNFILFRRNFLVKRWHENFFWLAHSLFFSVQKLFKADFRFVEPDLSAVKGDDVYISDADLVYFAHQLDVKKYLKSKNCKVLRYGADTFSASRIQFLAPYGGIVAVKNK